MTAGLTGKDPGEYPEYEGPEEGRDPDEIERALSASPFVRRMAEE